MQRRPAPRKQHVSSQPTSSADRRKRTKVDREVEEVRKSKYFSHLLPPPSPVALQLGSSRSRDTGGCGRMLPSPPLECTVPVECRLLRTFFDVPCVQLARSLLGQRLVRRQVDDGRRLCGIVVETEAYLGGDDLASHSRLGRRTERNEAMFMAPGTAYVYSVYGMHCCLNVSSAGDGAAVLIRAIQPTEGLSVMAANRSINCSHITAHGDGSIGGLACDDQVTDVCLACSRGLCSGPAKLCQAFAIGKIQFNKADLCNPGCDLWLEPAAVSVADDSIVASSRIGIDYAGEVWTVKPLRFYVKDNLFVSKFSKPRAILTKKCSARVEAVATVTE